MKIYLSERCTIFIWRDENGEGKVSIKKTLRIRRPLPQAREEVPFFSLFILIISKLRNETEIQFFLLILVLSKTILSNTKEGRTN